jgi:hypothetical protein
MAIDVASGDKEKVVYRVVPEQVSDEVISAYDEKNRFDEESMGWTEDRTMRKAGEVPFPVMYNYALAKGVPSTRIWEFFREDNCKEMKRLLNEFECFRCGNKFKGNLAK